MSVPAMTSPVARVANRKLNDFTQVDGNTNVQFTKEIRVKQLDPPAFSRPAPSSQPSPFPSEHSLSQASLMPQEESLHEVNLLGIHKAKPSFTAVLDIMNDAVKSVFPASDSAFAAWYESDEASRPPFAHFLDHVTSLDDEQCAQVFSLFASSVTASIMASSCLASPKEFWTFASHCVEVLLNCADSTRTFDATVDALEAVGRVMSRKDEHITWLMFCDFALPKLIACLTQSSHKARHAAKVIAGFWGKAHAERISVLTKLKYQLVSSKILCEAYASLIESDREPLNSELCDFYFNYGRDGLLHEAPAVRVASLSILASLAEREEVDGASKVLHIFGEVSELKEDSLVDVPIQIVRLCCAVLAHASSSDDDKLSQVHDVMLGLLRPQASPLLLQRAAMSLISCAELRPSLIKPLLSIMRQNSGVRNFVLGVEEVEHETDQASETNVQMFDSVSPVALASALCAMIAEEKRSNLSSGDVDLLAACVSQPYRSDPISEWAVVLAPIRSLLLAELCDAQLCQKVCVVLKALLIDQHVRAHTPNILELSDSDASQGLSAPPIFSVMKIVFAAGGNETCKTQLVQLFRELLSVSTDSFAQAIYSLLKNFGQFEPSKFQSYSGLPQLLLELEQAFC